MFKYRYYSTILSFFMILRFQALEAESCVNPIDPRYSYVLDSRWAGMFSIWYDVLTLLYFYEAGLIRGLEVNLNHKHGVYLDPRHGTNWWEYYCEPIRIGSNLNEKYTMGDPTGNSGKNLNWITRHEAKKLIDKYIHIKPYILEKVEQFRNEFFLGNYVIAIHFRGTDKISWGEARYISYDEVVDQVEKVIKENASGQYKLFVATDDQNFLNFMIQKYGNRLLFTDARRSTNKQAVHTVKTAPYKQGLEAIIDMLLLSGGDYLIKTSSNLSDFSALMNPDIPVLTIE